jgi:MOSC domain-containing protein YiiM
MVDDLALQGFPVFYGALGENLTTRGLDFRSLRPGDTLRAGGALLEITQPRGPCFSLDVYGAGIQQAIYDNAVKQLDPQSPRWGMSGFYARVLQPGLVRTGDIIAVVAALA